MARIGSFAGPTTAYGAPLGILHPVDNTVPRFDPLIAAESGLTEADRQELQDQLNELFAASRLARDWVG